MNNAHKSKGNELSWHWGLDELGKMGGKKPDLLVEWK
jgi:hypothetical protein